MSFIFFFKQKTAYEMRISDWSSDVCSSDLQVSRIDRYREIGTAARLVAGVDGFIGPCIEGRAGKDREVSTCREPHDADLVRIYAVLNGVVSNDGDGPLSVLQCHRNLGRFMLAGFQIPVASGVGNPVLHEDAGDAYICQPRSEERRVGKEVTGRNWG